MDKTFDGEDEAFAFLKSVFDLIEEEHVIGKGTRNIPVINFKHPLELQKHINFSIDKPVKDVNELREVCRQIIKHSVKTSHPHFYNQLYGGVDLYGLGGTWISESLNTNQHTFEIAPAFTLAENAVLKHVQKIIGYEDGDGIFSPGGSLSNMYGMVLARYVKYPDVKTKGVHHLPALVCFTSEEAHYSIEKGAHWLGFGTENVIKVETDDYGRMIPELLEMHIKQCISDGKVPLLVNATVGTTVLGAIDPLDKVADVCQKYKLWFHVDACFGGTLLLSNTYKTCLGGLDRSDSVAWNPHKMLGAPQQCALFLTRHAGLLHRCNCAAATYLFQQDKFYDVSYDTGDKSLQCGRKVDAFKLWVMWKARGDKGLEHVVDNTMGCTRYFQGQLLQREGFRLVLDHFETTCTCFWYIPEALRNMEENDEWKEKLYKVAPKIKEKMILAGSLMIGYTPLKQKGIGNFLRMVTTCQPPPTFKDMDYVISQIESFGKDISF